MMSLLVTWLFALVALVAIIVAPFAISPLRRAWISKPMLARFRQVMPRMSQTERDALEALFATQGVGYRSYIRGHAGVVQGGGQGLRAAAVPHVHADDVHPQAPCLAAHSDYILGVRRTFEAMNDDQRKARPPVALPMAHAANARVNPLGNFFDGNQPLLSGRQQAHARQEVSRQRLQVCIAKPPPWNEGLDFEGERLASIGVRLGFCQHKTTVTSVREEIEIAATRGANL